jgi:hypothetical protein
MGEPEELRTTWTARERALIGEFKKLAAPVAQPFTLGPGVIITDPALFHASLASDIAHGPRGPRALMGALRRDLEQYLSTKQGA